MQIKHDCFYRQTMELMRRSFKSSDVTELCGKYEMELRNSANIMQQRYNKITTKTINLVSNNYDADALERGAKESVRNSEFANTALYTSYTNTVNMTPEVNRDLDNSNLGLDSNCQMESFLMHTDLKS